MLRNTLKAAWAHKRRLVSTTLAVLLGVAFMSGTLVLRSTLQASVNEVFDDAFSELDAVVRGVEIIESPFGAERATIPEALVDTIAEVDGVEAVAPYVEVGGRVLGADGEPIGMAVGPPTFLQSWTDDEGLAGVQMVEGTTPGAPDEIVLNVGAAEDAEATVGDTVDVVTIQGTRTFTLVGTYRFGEADSALGATIVGITLPVAQELAGLDGQVQSIMVRGSDQLTQADLVDLLASVVPDDDDIEIITGQEFTDETSDTLNEGLSFFSILLFVFAVIALVVGAFIIFNTFSILVVQRGKELALLRAIGASRRQVLTSVLIEAVLVGLIAAIIGLVIGVLLAIGLIALLGAVGLDLPATSVNVRPDAIITALVTGVLVTLVAALVPAWRATRVAPLAALRDVIHDESGRSVIRAVIGTVLVAAAVALSLPALGDDPDGSALQMVGVGTFCLLLGLIVLGPVIARPVARAVGAPIARLRGTTGQLARENAARSPKRTASTAAALMLGVGLIVFINVVTASARASLDADVRRGLQAELIIQPSGFDLGIPLAMTEELRQLDTVGAVASLQGWLARVELPDDTHVDTFIQAIDPETYQQAIDVRMTEGSIDDLEPGTIIYDDDLAATDGVAVGDEVSITFTSGQRATFTVAALANDADLLGTRVVHQDDWQTYATEISDLIAFVVAADGADIDDLRADVEAVAEAYPTVAVQDQDEYLGGVADMLNQLLNVVYGLLFLSILISLIGIANTLSLSVHERTRELGLLRAVGMSRAQVRSAVRWEAVIMSLLGTGLGLLLGLTTGYALVRGLRAEGLNQFELPVVPLIIITVVFAMLGVVASLLPARRAAKLNILDAIAAE